VQLNDIIRELSINVDVQSAVLSTYDASGATVVAVIIYKPKCFHISITVC